MKNILILILTVASLMSCTKTIIEPKPANEYPMLTDDGAWCWFSDPRAIYHESGEGLQIVSGWVKQDGSIEAGSVNVDSDLKSYKILYDKLQRDDHDNPSFVEMGNGEVLTHYTKHGQGDVYQHVTSNKGDVKSFSDVESLKVIGEDELELFPRKTVTYANPFILKSEENRIYSFGRWTGFKPNMMWSDDNGQSWTKSKVFITNYPFEGGNRPYVKYFSDGNSKVHVIFTDGHPRNEPTNSVYYAYYEKGAFYKADESLICKVEDLPFEPKQASVIYKASKNTGRAWVFDVAADKNGYPVVAYTRYPNDEDHRYHYARLVDGKWIDNEICASGSWFPQTREGEVEKEPNYSAGLTLHPARINTVYLSRHINGVFEIEKRITKDKGLSWEVFPITQGSKYDNVRPFVPRNYKNGNPDVVLWMENEKYIHYTNYKTNIRYFIER